MPRRQRPQGKRVRQHHKGRKRPRGWHRKGDQDRRYLLATAPLSE